MHDYRKIKAQLKEAIIRLLDERIRIAKESMDSAAASKNNETKSTAGDKHETGRAMLQIEKDLNEAQFLKSTALKNELQHIDIDKEFSRAFAGALVYTAQGIYFLSLGIGKIRIDGLDYYAVSLASPIGELLQGKKTGDQFTFQNKSITILEIH